MQYAVRSCLRIIIKQLQRDLVLAVLDHRVAAGALRNRAPQASAKREVLETGLDLILDHGGVLHQLFGLHLCN